MKIFLLKSNNILTGDRLVEYHFGIHYSVVLSNTQVQCTQVLVDIPRKIYKKIVIQMVSISHITGIHTDFKSFIYDEFI